jgi:serine/threonine-protein kinase
MPVCPHCREESDDLGSACRCGEGYYVADASLEEAERDRYIGRKVDDKYAVVSKISKGGMGTVYLAIQHPVERKVALKVLRADLEDNDEIRERFDREARAVASIQHPNIVTLHDFGVDDSDFPYMVMEYAPGTELHDWIHGEGSDLDRILHVLRQMLSALADAHEAGVVHRDLKPENVIVRGTGTDRDFIKLLDFGIARLVNQTTAGLTKEGEVFGTPNYMSPEQAEGEVGIGAPADVYAVGIIAYEMLCGECPFDAPKPMTILFKQTEEELPPLEPRPGLEVPPGLEHIVRKATAKPPRKRFADAGEMLDALERFEREGTPAIANPAETRASFEGSRSGETDQDWPNATPEAAEGTRRIASSPRSGPNQTERAPVPTAELSEDEGLEQQLERGATRVETHPGPLSESAPADTLEQRPNPEPPGDGDAPPDPDETDVTDDASGVETTFGGAGASPSSDDELFSALEETSDVDEPPAASGTSSPSRAVSTTPDSAVSSRSSRDGRPDPRERETVEEERDPDTTGSEYRAWGIAAVVVVAASAVVAALWIASRPEGPRATSSSKPSSSESTTAARPTTDEARAEEPTPSTSSAEESAPSKEDETPPTESASSETSPGSKEERAETTRTGRAGETEPSETKAPAIDTPTPTRGESDETSKAGSPPSKTDRARSKHDEPIPEAEHAPEPTRRKETASDADDSNESGEPKSQREVRTERESNHEASPPETSEETQEIEKFGAPDESTSNSDEPKKFAPPGTSE